MAIIPNFQDRMKLVFKVDPLKPIMEDFIKQGATLDDLLETIGAMSEKDYKEMFFTPSFPIPREHFILILSNKFKEAQG